MPRARIAIAHFDSAASAEATRRTLSAMGASAVALHDGGTRAGKPAQFRLEVQLSTAGERQLLDILLNSEATRVDVHDAESPGTSK